MTNVETIKATPHSKEHALYFLKYLQKVESIKSSFPDELTFFEKALVMLSPTAVLAVSKDAACDLLGPAEKQEIKATSASPNAPFPILCF